jgi:hypothetical protein
MEFTTSLNTEELSVFLYKEGGDFRFVDLHLFICYVWACHLLKLKDF